LGEGYFHRREDDQRGIGDGCGKAGLSRINEKAALPDTGGWEMS